MAEEDRTFNYNDLNLDFLELSPPRARRVVRNVTPLAGSTHFRSNAFKAKQLAQKVQNNDVLVNKIDVLGSENTAMKQKLKDFQKSASQIQELYESEKQKCSNLQTQYKELELTSHKLEKRFTLLNNDLEEKKLQLEQLQAQVDIDKGPLSYTELAIKYLKLFQELDEEDIFSKTEKTLCTELSKYCEEAGCTTAQVKSVKLKKKRNYKKTKEVECKLIQTDTLVNPKASKTQSTQTCTTSHASMHTQTAALHLPTRHMQTQTQAIANEEFKAPVTTLITQSVQTTPIELRTQGTQHISITTTRGTSTACFIKKHNVGTCFPEPKLIPPVTVMVEELLQLYSISPLSPIADPVSPPSPTAETAHELMNIPPVTQQQVLITTKSIGTCTYLCNVQRQIDFIPIYAASIKRSKSSSPSPACTCGVSIKNEAYATPTPSPPPPIPAPGPLSTAGPTSTQSAIPLQVSTTATSSHSSSVTAASSTTSNANLSNMQPMLNAFTHLPEMQPEVFSTIWQMAGQMFMGLFYAPSNNRRRSTQLNETNTNSIDQQQFNNWLYTVYESMQQPAQRQTTSPDMMDSVFQRNSNVGEATVDLNAETNSTSLSYSNNSTTQQAEESSTQEIYNDSSTNVSANPIEPIIFAAAESTQTDRGALPTKSTDCIFKEPLEIPKRSAKQAHKRSRTEEELTYMKKYRDKRLRKKRKKEKQQKMATQQQLSPLVTDCEYDENMAGQSLKETTLELNASQQDEFDFATAVEFCAKLCSFNNDVEKQIDKNEVNADTSDAGSSTENSTQMRDLDSEELTCDHSMSVNINLSQGGASGIEGDVRTSLRVDRINDNFEDKVENVPKLKLSGTAKNKCDNLDKIELVNLTASTIEDTAYRISVGCGNLVKHDVNSLFGSDTDDEDMDAMHVKDSYKSGPDEERGKGSLVLEGNTLTPLKSQTINEDRKSIEKLHDTSTRAKDVSSGANLPQLQIETNTKKLEALPSTLLNQNNEVLVENENHDEYNTSVEEALLADLSMSESEDEEEFEQNTTRKSSNNVNIDYESDQADEPVLVIVEQDLEDNQRRKRTASETSVASDLSIKSPNTESPTKTDKEESDTDISAILDNTLVEDLLASATTQQIYKSILKEKAENEANGGKDALTAPRMMRGRKRTPESENFIPCKLASGLCANQHDSDNSSNDESLSPEYKTYTDKNEISTNFERLGELKQKCVLKTENMSTQIHNEVEKEFFEKDKNVTETINKPTSFASDTPSEHSSTTSLLRKFRPSRLKERETSSNRYQSRDNQIGDELATPTTHINHKNYDSPASPPQPLSNKENTSDSHECPAMPLESKSSKNQSSNNQSHCESQAPLQQNVFESPYSPTHFRQNYYETTVSPPPPLNNGTSDPHVCPAYPLALKGSKNQSADNQGECESPHSPANNQQKGYTSPDSLPPPLIIGTFDPHECSANSLELKSTKNISLQNQSDCESPYSATLIQPNYYESTVSPPQSPANTANTPDKPMCHVIPFALKGSNYQSPHIQSDYESPYLPALFKQNYYEPTVSPPQSLVNKANTTDPHECVAIPLALKGSKNQTPHQSDCESPYSPAHTQQNNSESTVSPPQPPHTTTNDILKTSACPEIPLELNREYYPIQRKTILQHLINNYSADIYAIVTGKTKAVKSNSKIALQLHTFLNTTQERVDVSASTLAHSLHEEIDDTEIIASLIVDQVMSAPRPHIELNCELGDVPPKYLGTHLRLIAIVLRHLQYKRADVVGVLLAKIENKLFNYQNNENIKLEAALNLTQLYLILIPMNKQTAAGLNPARLFIAKSLYYYNVLAHPMIYEVLLWYPTTLPSREERTYDRSDALITVIQHLLMCQTYNMDTKDLRHKELLSLLRFEYHFEPFKPKSLEVLSNLVAKLKAGHLTNLKYAFAIFCKRHTKLVDILLQQQLLPLADEYYKLVQNTDEYDERIAALMDCISSVVKPLPLDTDVTLYHSIFERFLVAVQRSVVQEAAVLAILRLQRFGQCRCFHTLAHFRPHYTLQLLTSNSLKTFIHKKPLSFWKGLLWQNKE